MTVEWAEPAVSDLEGIRDFIGRDSKHYATRFVEKVVEAVENLDKFPKIGRSVPEVEEENIRELLLHSYRIIYRVETHRISILTVIHGARDLSQRKPKPWDIV